MFPGVVNGSKERCLILYTAELFRRAFQMQRIQLLQFFLFQKLNKLFLFGCHARYPVRGNVGNFAHIIIRPVQQIR